MGLLSDVGKGLEGAVKGTVRGVGGLFESVGQEFRRFSKTDLGRAAIAGAAIYFGGGELGWWDTPFTTAAGTAAGVVPATEVGGGLAQEMLAGGEAMTAGTAQAAAPVTTLGSSLPSVQAGVAPATEAGGGLTQELLAGGKTAPKGNWFTNLHPLAQYGLLQSGMGAVQGAFTPNAIDVERERAKLAREEDERRRQVWNQNTAVGNVNLGFKPKPLLGSRLGG